MRRQNLIYFIPEEKYTIMGEDASDEQKLKY